MLSPQACVRALGPAAHAAAWQDLLLIVQITLVRLSQLNGTPFSFRDALDDSFPITFLPHEASLRVPHRNSNTKKDPE